MLFHLLSACFLSSEKTTGIILFFSVYIRSLFLWLLWIFFLFITDFNQFDYNVPWYNFHVFSCIGGSLSIMDLRFYSFYQILTNLENFQPLFLKFSTSFSLHVFKLHVCLKLSPSSPIRHYFFFLKSFLDSFYCCFKFTDLFFCKV